MRNYFNRIFLSLTTWALSARDQVTRRPARGIEFLEWVIIALVIAVAAWGTYALLGDRIVSWVSDIIAGPGT